MNVLGTDLFFVVVGRRGFTFLRPAVPHATTDASVASPPLCFPRTIFYTARPVSSGGTSETISSFLFATGRIRDLG
jgi:hypothetical protein